jgi:hypothetical protein
VDWLFDLSVICIRRFPFSIKYDTLETRLGTDDEQTRLEWMNILRNLISNLKQQQQQHSQQQQQQHSQQQQHQHQHQHQQQQQN